MLVACQSTTIPNRGNTEFGEDVFERTGRIIVKNPQRSFAGAFRWLQDTERFHLRIRDKLGLMSVSVSGTEEDAQIRTSLGADHSQVNLKESMLRFFGVSFPLNDTKSCIELGCDLVKYASDHQYDSSGRLTGFFHSGWIVEVEYEDSQSNEAKRFFITKEDTSVDVKFDEQIR